MNKLLYHQPTQQTKPYPRSDGQAIEGLDPDFLVLTRVENTLPTITETQSLVANWVIDVEALEYRQEWSVVDNPPVPNWSRFYKQLKVSATYQYLIGLSISVPNISGVMAAMGLTIQDGIRDPSDPDIPDAFQASVNGVLSALNAIGQPLTTEQLAEVRELLDSNGFGGITL